MAISYRLVLWLAMSVPAVTLAGDETEPPVSDFETTVETLEPLRRRSEARQDEIHAATMRAHARVLLHRGEFEKSLRHYQRAWRYQPQWNDILPRIVFLANHLKRRDEAARYAVIAVDKVEVEPILLRRLALQFSGERNWQGALRLYEQAYASETAENEAPDDSLILMRAEMGRMYFLTKDYENAASVLEGVLQQAESSATGGSLKVIRDQSDRFYAMLAECCMENGNLKDAEKFFRKLNDHTNDQPRLAFNLARVDDARGKYGKALNHLNSYFASKKNTAGTAPYELLDKLTLEMSQNKEQARRQLIDRLNELRRDGIDDKSLRLFLADQLKQAGRLDEAQKLLKGMLASSASSEVDAALLAIHQQRDNHKQILNVLSRSASAAGSLDSLGESLDRLVADETMVAALVDLANTELTNAPEKVADGTALAMTWLAVKAGRFDEALTLLEAAAPAMGKDKAEIMINLGVEFLFAEQYAAAIDLLKTALDEPSLPEERKGAIFFYLTRATELNGDTDAALQWAKRTAAAMPDSPRFQSQPAWVLYHAKRHTEARREYRKVLDQFRANYGSAMVRSDIREIRLVLSSICASQDDLAAAEELLEQVLDEFPEDVGAMNDLAYLWADENKRLDRALAMIQKAVAAEPENQAYIDSLGWVYYRLGRIDEAIVELEKAAAGEAPDGVILDHLGDAYLAAKRTDKALQHWRRAAESFRGNSDSKHLTRTIEKIKQYEK